MPFESNARTLLGLVTLALATTSCVAQLNISCFFGGPTFNCTSLAPQFCASIGSIVVAPGDTSARCFNGPGVGENCVFTLANQGTVADVPSAGNCLSALNSVAAACPPGGSGQVTGLPFRFWIDPNDGVCPKPELDL
ncbi:hypothetical protein C8R43DRAFT_161230 [Mycena crocata]|nr:hypothetical protein C8R43DRAFT_161230 [Mycena crocata]